MEKLTAFFDSIDLETLLPELDTLLGKVQLIASVAMLLGPVLMLLFGLWYFLLPPKEANHKAGFRTWFGMGSVEAWRFAQRLAGIIYGVLGLILTVVMGILCLNLREKALMDMVTTAFTCLLWQVGLALISYLAICAVCAIRYKSNGSRR